MRLRFGRNIPDLLMILGGLLAPLSVAFPAIAVRHDPSWPRAAGRPSG